VISKRTGRPVFFWRMVARSTAGTVGGDVLNFELHHIAAAKFAVDGKIEEREIA
jgi:hypothetical protein